AVRRFSALFPDLAEAAGQLGDRPLPSSYEVRLRPEHATDEAVEAVSAARSILAAVLVVAAALTVASVIRLALHARQQEVEIMHLVGAPLAFIRGPFVFEGVLQGGVGALVALALLYGLHLVARARIGDLLAG